MRCAKRCSRSRYKTSPKWLKGIVSLADASLVDGRGSFATVRLCHPALRPKGFRIETRSSKRKFLAKRRTINDGFMRIAYLDCFSGISGDMFLGALIDAGVPQKLFEETVTALNVGAVLEISRANRSGISATKVDVI